MQWRRVPGTVWILNLARVRIVLANALQRAKELLTHKGLHFVLLAMILVIFACAGLVLSSEVHAHGSNIHGFADALWWAMTTVTTVGYGDRFPVTADRCSHPFHSPGFDGVDGDPVDAGCTLVPCHVDPRLPHHIPAGELVVEGVESTCRVLLGTAVEHALEGLEITDSPGFGNVPGPKRGMVVAVVVGTGWLI